MTFGPYVIDKQQQTIVAVGPENPLKWLWNKAAAEWG
jgi:hypothetical protein